MQQSSLRLWATIALSSAVLATMPLGADVPTFLTGPQAGNPKDLALSFLSSEAGKYGLSPADLAELEVTDHYRTRHNGVTHLWLRQRHQGIPVFNGVIGINVTRDGAIINLNNSAVSGLAGKVNTTAPRISAEEAVQATAAHLGLVVEGLAQVDAAGGPSLARVFNGAGISQDDIPVSLMYQPVADGSVRLVWRTVIRQISGSDWWEVRVDALTGQVLDKNNWTAHASQHAKVTRGSGACYNAIPVPAADPNDSNLATQQTCAPENLNASPFLWHDDNGVVGAEYTDTRGNNVHAQDDLDANNTGGTRPSGGASLQFLPTWDPGQDPTAGTNTDASIVNLFYYNNIMHDITYQYGFDEAAGNFQTNNYGNGGLGNDHVFADALDGSGTNNANFGTPPDGSNPRMQMFRWLYPFPNEVAIDSPGSIAGSYQASSANFGPALTTTGITGNIVLAIDGSGTDVNDGCEALTNGAALAGNIALINRGSCNFTVKVKNAQLAGATAALIKKITPGGPSALGGTDGTITIPSGMISLADGNMIVAELANGAVHATFRDLATQPEPDRDSDLDNGIIAHEYGHGISNRLVGGPANTSCLTGSEQMGEGMSDFWTVVLSPRADDTASTQRGVGTYVIFEGRNGLGIRAFPYSTSLTVNPQTYSSISAATTTIPHGVGSIWMSMVYEVYQELIARYGLDMDLYNGTGGNNLLIQLVIDAMKLVGCNPNFVSFRNAMLLADQTNNASANQCEIWRGFAKRGVGVNAVAGSTNVGDETQDFTLPGNCSASPNYVFDDGFETGSTSRWTATSP